MCIDHPQSPPDIQHIMASAGQATQPSTTQHLSPIDTASSKRLAPEDEVQFVSSKPVKKRRTSLPSSQKPIASPHAETTQPRGPPNAAMDQLSAAPVSSNQEAPSTPSCEPPAPIAIISQGILAPGMECFTFPPQASSVITNLPPHASPALSPKQLPVPFEQSGPHSANIPAQQSMDIVPFPDLFHPADFEGLGSPWELANWVPQPTLMTPEAALNQRMLNPPSHLQPDTQALGPPSEYSMTLPSPMPSSQLYLSQTPLTGHTVSNAQDPETMRDRLPTPLKQQSPQVGNEETPLATPGDGKTDTPEPVVPHEPLNSEAEQGMPPPSLEPHALKPPCLICAKLRQQAMINQANGKGLGVISPATAAAEHHFHIHTSHQQPLIAPGPGNGPVQASQMSFQYLNSPRGMMYANGVPPVNGTLRSVPPYLLGGVLAQATGLPGANSMMAPPVQFATVHNPQNIPATKRQNPGSAKKSLASSSPAGKTRAPAAAKRKPPPNLIVDVAETCEEVFPFDEVAKRHSVPRHKVVEVFSAIVQLPLLRCATDKRRSGKLAQTRMKEFAKAKKESPGAGNTAAQGKPEAARGQAHDKRPILPGVMELARTMPPLEYTGDAKHGFTGPW